MKKFLSAALAVAIATSSTVAFTGAAEAGHRHYYNGGHHHHHHNDELAAGILGFALGAVVAGAATHYYAPRRTYYTSAPAPYAGYDNRGYDDGDHVQRCEAHYRSYDRYSDTFIGYDGRRYYCNF